MLRPDRSVTLYNETQSLDIGASAGLSASSGAVYLVTRGDDAGLCESANLAMVAACTRGIVRNVGIMAVGPAVAHAVDVLADVPGIALGLHLALTCEWQGAPWGPVSDPEKIPSLVDARGRFAVGIERIPTHAESAHVEREVRAQLDRLRSLGASLTYLDDHMGFAWSPRIRSILQRIASSEGLILGETTSLKLPAVSLPPDADYDPVGAFCRRISEAPAGCYLHIFHPALHEPDMARFIPVDADPVSALAGRVLDSVLCCHPEVLRAIASKKVKLARYDQARPGTPPVGGY